MAEFFSCDWGTTSFRLRRVDSQTGRVLDQRREPTGARVLFARCPPGDSAARQRAFADFLDAQLQLLSGNERTSLDGVSVLVSGMASSSVGWRELAYARVPVDLDGTGLVHESFLLKLAAGCQVQIHLISGVRTENDMLRGEETEILGLFAGGRYPAIAQEGLVLLPGTHSKHVRLQERQLAGFNTYMTGELFDVLSAHSLLRASVEPDGDTAKLSEPGPREAFLAGVRGAAQQGLAHCLFQTRARTVLDGVPPSINRWFLSGLLIGSETAALASGPFQRPILLAAAEPLSAAYRLALETLGCGERLTVVPPHQMDVASVEGHCALLRRFSKPGGTPCAE